MIFLFMARCGSQSYEHHDGGQVPKDPQRNSSSYTKEDEGM